MNLLSKLSSSTKAKTIEPREIFMTLPSKAPGYGYPRDVQSEVWKKWFDIRNEKNVILKMNTGSGKTVVGLIMLQSCLNEEKGPAIYVVPDNYLVKQVIDEAKRLGISATEDKDDYSYSNSKALEKNAEWVATCKENLAAVKYSNEAKVDEKIVAQRKAFENAINMQWSDAANTIKSVKDKEKDKKTKGYLYQIQAEYTNKIDPALSQEVLKAGKKLNAAILSPIAGIQYQRTINTIPQAQAISTNLDAEKLGLNELLVYVDGILANLCMGSEYEKFEEALSQIGTILGFVCSRPDKETGGYGPDNLWAIDTGKYLVIECKTEATTQTIKKDYCNQLSGSVNWFKENYVYPNECVPIMIHPSKVVDEVASPDENMRVMTEKELTCFRKNLRDFYSTLCQNGNLSDVNKINELLRIYKLRKDDIVNRYTVKFERKD